MGEGGAGRGWPERGRDQWIPRAGGGVGLVTSSVTIEKWEVCPGREVCVQGVRKSKEEG